MANRTSTCQRGGVRRHADVEDETVKITGKEDWPFVGPVVADYGLPIDCVPAQSWFGPI